MNYEKLYLPFITDDRITDKLLPVPLTNSLCDQIGQHVITVFGPTTSQHGHGYVIDDSLSSQATNVSVARTQTGTISNSQPQQQNMTLTVEQGQALIKALRDAHASIEESSAITDNFRKVVIDYISGFASSINPLPIETTQLFCPDDRLALHSDWLMVRSDLAAMYEAVKTARKFLEGHSYGRREGREQPEVARAHSHADDE
ncbi:MAG: hypothetical protein ACHQRJ_17745 [Alphaproteobacteria bacterium]